MIVVFDLDGTLADNSRREHIAHRAAAAAKHGEPTGAIWDEFHEHIPDDHPVQAVADVLVALAMHPGHTIEIWTARPAKYKHLTVEWMKKHGLPWDVLLMREDGDWRKAYILKLEWFLKRVPAARPKLVFEDHPETTRLLRAAGAVVAQVNEGYHA